MLRPLSLQRKEGAREMCSVPASHLLSHGVRTRRPPLLLLRHPWRAVLEATGHLLHAVSVSPSRRRSLLCASLYTIRGLIELRGFAINIFFRDCSENMKITITQQSLSFWSYVTGATALVVALVLFILSFTEKSGAIGYIVGGMASLLVGAAAITLGVLASHANKGQKTPVPATTAPPLRPPSAPTTAPPPNPPSPPSSEDEPPSDAVEDESASDADDDNASQTTVTNHTLAPTIPMEEEDMEDMEEEGAASSPPLPLRKEPTFAAKSPIKRPVRVSRIDKRSSSPR